MFLAVKDPFNWNLEHASRLADFLEFGELMAQDALHRERILWWPFP